MCAPRSDLAKLAIAGAAIYATGGSAAPGRSGFLLSGAAGGASLASNTSVLSQLATFARTTAPYIGAASSVYSGYISSQMLAQRANFTDFKVGTEREAFALRKVKRTRDMLRKIGAQRALYGVSGVTIEGTPGDIIDATAANFAEDQFIDAFNTSQRIMSGQFSSDAYSTESSMALLGGFTSAATTLAERGDLGVKGVNNLLTTNRNNLVDTGIKSAEDDI